MKKNQAKLLAVIGGSAVVSLGALGVAVGQPQTGPGPMASSQMSTGVTIPATTAPPTLDAPVATPRITGPAPLPAEEQGLPG